MKKVMMLAVIAVVVAMAGAAFAALPNATVVVTGTIPGVCHFDTVPALNVNLDPAAGDPASGTANLTFWCTNGTSWTLLDPNNSSAGSYLGTLDDGSGNTIGYTLTFTNATGGPTAGRTDVKTSVLTATVPLANFQNMPVGTYSQNVVFTINP